MIRHVAILFPTLLAGILSSGQTYGIEYRQLKQLAAESVRTRSVRIEPPSKEVSDGRLYFDYGGAWCGYIGEDDRPPYEDILNAQLHVEVIRQYRSRPNQRRFWTPYLERCEAKIESALVAFNRATTDQERKDAQQLASQYWAILSEAVEADAAQLNLRVDNGGAAQRGGLYKQPPGSPAEMLVHIIRQFDDQEATQHAETLFAAFQATDSSVTQPATESRLWKIYGELEERALAAESLATMHHTQKGWGVALTTAPVGATIYLMPAIEVRLAEIDGRPPRWKVVVQTDYLSVEGLYFYYLKWPDGKFSGPVQTRITGKKVILR